MISAFAPAKINLTLHVTGQRPDGYHLLDSLVVFVDVGDQLVFESATDLTLEINGPMAKGIPDGPGNLILRAARLADPERGAKITLTKSLPAAAGIGGGSSDAAATLKSLSTLWNKPMPVNPERLGADVPVCLRTRTTRMQGIGDILSDAPALPATWLVLVNPGVSVPTPVVFRNLAAKTNGAMPDALPNLHSVPGLADWLGKMRNDLQTPAITQAPVIKDVLTALEGQTDCLMARMSGSGATCWGMFGTQAAADEAARHIQSAHPSWWCVSTAIKSFS